MSPLSKIIMLAMGGLQVRLPRIRGYAGTTIRPYSNR